MSLPIFKSGEALYTVIIRDPAANDHLSRWSKTSKSIQARVEDNRMQVYDHNTFSLFVVTWAHSWDHVVIWDPWNKRHITW